ncbi:MAG: Smr/MutS family protein [Bacteroidota bacterium]
MPRLDDNGTTVTLDLHGATVDDALGLVLRTAALAARRGRATLRVVHGSSTSDALARNHTIKHALHDLLDDGDLPDAQGDVRFEGETLISLPLASSSSPSPIRLLDVR